MDVTPATTHYQECSLPRAHDERVSEKECQLPRVVFPQYWTIFWHHMKVLGQGKARHTSYIKFHFSAFNFAFQNDLPIDISVCSSGQLIPFMDQFRANFVSSEVNLKHLKVIIYIVFYL